MHPPVRQKQEAKLSLG